MKIFLLEDETILKESIEEFLSAKNYKVDSFENSSDAFDAIFTKEYDLLLLDVNVPGKFNGFSLRKELADVGKNIPTIFVTSMSSADAMLQGYANGCCDYQYDVINRKLISVSREIQLSKTENDILTLFIKHRNQIVTFEMLYEQIWENNVEAANARVQINNLRRKLPKDVIQNIYAIGYRLDCQ